MVAVGPTVRFSQRAERLDASRKVYAGVERHGKKLARVLSERTTTTPLVAVSAIGAFGYYSMFPIVDIWGLVDPYIVHSEPNEIDMPPSPNPWDCRRNPGQSCGQHFINLIWHRQSLFFEVPGHRRTNADYVMERRPDYVILPTGPLARAVRPALRGIFDHPVLAAEYHFDETIRVYVRRNPMQP